MIIGISGKARAGKTTTANMLVDEFNFKKFALADELKSYLIKYFGIPEEDLYLKKTPQSRKLAQDLGVFMREVVDKDYWIGKLTEKIIYDLESNIVIDDIRFKNEAEYIKDLGGYLIRIDRPGASAEAQKDHVSETELDDYKNWDMVLNNKGTISDLHYILSDWMYSLKKEDDNAW